MLDKILYLPDGVTVTDAQKLVRFAERVVEQAVIALSRHCVQMHPDLPDDRKFYLAALGDCRSCSLAVIKELKGAYEKKILEKFPPHDADSVIQSLEQYYTNEDALPSSFYQQPELIKDILRWEVLSDIRAFTDLFGTKKIPPNDPRDIWLCLQNALERNRLVPAFNAAEIAFDPALRSEEPKIIIAFLPRPMSPSERARFEGLDRGIIPPTSQYG